MVNVIAMQKTCLYFAMQQLIVKRLLLWHGFCLVICNVSFWLFLCCSIPVKYMNNGGKKEESEMETLNIVAMIVTRAIMIHCCRLITTFNKPTIIWGDCLLRGPQCNEKWDLTTFISKKNSFCVTWAPVFTSR